MAKVLVSDQYLTNIAAAIRSLKGVSTTFTPAEMATAISGIAKKSSTDLTVSGATVTAPAGYYASAASKAVASMTLPTAAATSATSGFTSKATIGRSTSAQYINIPTGYNAAGAYYTISATPNGSATTPATSITANPTISVNTTNGKITASVSGSKSVTPTVSAGYVSAGTAGTISVSGSATSDLSTQAAATITPTETEQTAVAANKYTLGAIKVAAISSTYVGSGITSRSSTDLSASGATVTVPAGYYSAQASKSVSTMTLPTSAASSATSGYTSKATIGRSTSAQYINIPAGYNSTGGYYTISATPNGSATAPSSISGTSATLSTGTNTLTLTKTISVTPTVSAGYVSAGTAGNSSVSLTASVTTKAAATYTPSETAQEIAAGQYLTGKQTISAIPSTYVGSGITARSSSDLTVNDKTVTVPAGYYASDASKEVSVTVNSLSVTPSATQQVFDITNDYQLIGRISVNDDTYTKVQDTELGRQVYSHTYSVGLSGFSNGDICQVTGTIGVPKSGLPTYDVQDLTGKFTWNSSNTYIKGKYKLIITASSVILRYTGDNTIGDGLLASANNPDGYCYIGFRKVSGADGYNPVTISGDANLTAANIKNGVSIFGVTGTLAFQTYYTGSSAPTSSLGADGDIYLQS